RGRGRVEAAPELELAARARLEAPEPVRDAVLDARVVADVEVEVAERALGAPVAAVERVALGDVEGAGDHLAILARDHEHEARASSAAASSGRQKLTCAEERWLSPHVASSAVARVAITSPRSAPGALRKRAPVTGVKGTATSSFG